MFSHIYTPGSPNTLPPPPHPMPPPGMGWGGRVVPGVYICHVYIYIHIYIYMYVYERFLARLCCRPGGRANF